MDSDDGANAATPPDVARLLADARSGDAKGRERLFEASRGYLGLVARAKIETWLQAKVDASDLVQQTLLEAFCDFDRFRGATEAEWLAWLRRILRNNATDFARHYGGADKRQAKLEIAFRGPGDDSAAGGAPEPVGPEETPSRTFARRDEELRLAAAIERLSPDYREVIVLRNLERLPFEDIATRMARSRPATQMLWARAIRKLQDELKA